MYQHNINLQGVGKEKKEKKKSYMSYMQNAGGC